MGCEHGHHAHEGAAAPAETAIDPVCGMTVKLGAGKPHYHWKDADYHFCSQKCHDRFAADPWFYVSGNAKKRAKKPAKVAISKRDEP